MPKKYGVKEKDQVVSHILNLVLTGKLRSGDRVDRNEIALGLGVSRVPIQEALVQLEHDGVVSTRYHRGAFELNQRRILRTVQRYGAASPTGERITLSVADLQRVTPEFDYFGA